MSSVDWDLVWHDFQKTFTCNIEDALDSFNRLLLDKDTCRARVEFLRSLERDGFAKEIALIGGDGVYRSSASIAADRLAQLTSNPDALWQAHLALVGDLVDEAEDIAENGPAAPAERLKNSSADTIIQDVDKPTSIVHQNGRDDASIVSGATPAEADKWNDFSLDAPMHISCLGAFPAGKTFFAPSSESDDFEAAVARLSPRGPLSAGKPPNWHAVDLERFFDDLSEHIYIKDSSHRFVYINAACAAAFGVTRREDVYGWTDDNIFTEEHARQTREDERRIMETGQAKIDYEEFETWQDGRRTYVVTTKIPLRDRYGSVIGIVGESKQFDELKKLRAAVDGSNDGHFHFDIRDRVVWYSKRWKEILGYSEHDLANDWETWHDLIHPDDRQAVIYQVIDVLRGEKDFFYADYRLRAKDGKYRWIRARGRVARDSSGQPLIFAGSHIDIDQSKRNEELSKQVLDTLPVFVFVKRRGHDGQFHFVHTNKALCDAVGKRDLTGMTDADITTDAAQIARFHEADNKVLETRSRLVVEEEDFTDHTGKQWKLSTIKVPLCGAGTADETDVQVLGVSTDITALCNARDEIRQEQRFLQILLDHLPEVIFFKDDKGRFTRVSQALADLVQVESPASLIGLTDRDVFGQIDRAYADQSVRSDREILRGAKPVFSKLVALRTRQGVKERLLTKVPIIVDDRIIGIVGIARDLTATLTDERVRVLKQFSRGLKQAANSGRVSGWSLAFGIWPHHGDRRAFVTAASEGAGHFEPAAQHDIVLSSQEKRHLRALGEDLHRLAKVSLS